ncbi:hypothetical protein B0H13DRAFT_2559255 [Mycena leptocephala]|nr:hypothetical protein B0H13DRAFT_2559255 [Mycena leptocephala]
MILLVLPLRDLVETIFARREKHRKDELARLEEERQPELARSEKQRKDQLIVHLQHAIRETAKTETLRESITNGADINGVAPITIMMKVNRQLLACGCPATLILAASRTDAEFVTMLLAQSAAPNIRGDSNIVKIIQFQHVIMVLHYKQEGHLNIVKPLIESGANVNITIVTIENHAYVSYITEVRLERPRRAMRDRGAEVNTQEGDWIRGGLYGTALQAASYGEHLNIVKHGGLYGIALRAAVSSRPSLGSTHRVFDILLF